jgi:hypothetical protein
VKVRDHDGDGRASAYGGAWERRLHADAIASYEKSLPLAVPGRVLVQVWTIDDDVLALDYARDERSEPDVIVRSAPAGIREWRARRGSGTSGLVSKWRRIDG